MCVYISPRTLFTTNKEMVNSSRGERDLLYFVFVLYMVYGVLGTIGLVSSIMQCMPLYVHLVPAVINAIHLIALSVAGLIISDCGPYPVEPMQPYLIVDFFMAASSVISFYLLSTDDKSSNMYFHMAVASNTTVLVGTFACLWKSKALLD